MPVGEAKRRANRMFTDDFEKNIVFPVFAKVCAKKPAIDFFIVLNLRDCRLGHTLHLVS